ncbi:hypothetical protein LR48_Vigan11g101100 [Vigna angularis]|uniref:Ubiquitin-like protease family profile domain-containing protein n=1 Tax=Phaseolus angularis TaxID=3914 RepID=A0A0L9VSS2_PHAAN|nr:hypothetical protein LR48_Vigan11g101100 [Vigna angularis]
MSKTRAEALGLESPNLAPAPSRYELWKVAETKSDGKMTSSSTALISQKNYPIEYSGQYELLIDGDPPRIVAVGQVLEEGQTIHGVPLLSHHVRVTIDEVQDPRYMDTVIVDQDRSSMYGFVEPQTIQPFGNTIESKQKYLETWMAESNRDIYFVPYIDGSHWQLMLIIFKQCKIVWFCSLHRKMKNDLRNMLQGVMGKNQGQLVFVLYLKVCNKQPDSWECGYYVMSWIKTIIRVVITDDWNERVKSTYVIPEDAIKKIRQEWTTYLLQRWT